MAKRRDKSDRTARMMSRARSSVWVRAIVGRVGAAYVWLTYKTTRWTFVRRDHLDVIFEGRGCLVGIWHSRLALTPMLPRKRGQATALISRNSDGDMISRVVLAFGVDVIRGSSRDPRKASKDRGGTEALQQMVAAAKAGQIVVAAPDGPRGPRQRVKPGVAIAAARARKPLYPLACSVRNALVLKSWDRFQLPLPFGRGVWVFGDPIQPPEASDDAAMARFIAEVEAGIDACTREADRLTGRETPEPGPVLAESAA